MCSLYSLMFESMKSKNLEDYFKVIRWRKIINYFFFQHIYSYVNWYENKELWINKFVLIDIFYSND